MISIVVVAAITTWLQCARCDITKYSELQIKEAYESFLKEYPRDFDNDMVGFNRRIKIFRDNVQLIEQSNNENSTARYGITKFADWTDEEFNEFTRPLLGPGRRKFRQYEDGGWIQVSWDGSRYPPHWDWRDYGGVTPVKTQSYKCNSCYAYAVTAVVESLYAIKYRRYISISEYEMLDCDFSNDGCRSGSTRRSMARGKYMGFTRMMNYPGMLWHNYFCPRRGEYFVSKLYAIDPDPNTIAWFVSNVAPVALNLAFPKRYKFYKYGVLPDAYECWTMEPNHAAEVIGYGVEQGKMYWLMKNSWGDWWGDRGFFKMERGINACQIETHATSAGL